MRIATTLLLLATLIGLATGPVVAFLILSHQFPVAWLTELQNYQTLFDTLVALFAASLASIGVALTIWNQGQITSKQLAPQRQEQDRSRSLAKQQIASAFIGEIDAARVSRTSARGGTPRSDERERETQAGTVNVGKYFGRFFDSNPENVGLFPSAVSEGLTRFYSTLEEIKLDLDWYTNAIKSTFTPARKSM
jgi:hypothetical protein